MEPTQLKVKTQILEGEQGTTSATMGPAVRQPLTFAYYVTGHGLGHATRVAEVTRELLKLGHTVHVVRLQRSCRSLHFEELQNGLIKPACGTRRSAGERCPRVGVSISSQDGGRGEGPGEAPRPQVRVGQWVEAARCTHEPREYLIETESRWLRANGVNLVITDVVPIACPAGKAAGIPVVCVTNFSWDFVYSEYLTAAGGKYRQMVWQIANDYSKAQLLLRLPGYVPMPAFRDVVDVPLVVRTARRSKEEVRRAYNIPLNDRLLLLCFGGQSSEFSLEESYLPEGWHCIVCAGSTTKSLPPRFLVPPADEYIPDLLNASDAMLGKIGYGTTSEALAHNVPLIFIRRDYFNEEPFLRKLLQHHSCSVEMSRRDFHSGNWSSYLLRALRIKPQYHEPLNGGEVVADILCSVAEGKYTHKESNSEIRLRDAIVFGYQLQRARNIHPTESDGSLAVPLQPTLSRIPDWYTKGLPLALEDLELDPSVTNSPKTAGAALEFDVLRGNKAALRSFRDTTQFLELLQSLDDLGKSPRVLEHTSSSHDIRASRGLFQWGLELVVARAPGRLDVMGGIADYSGSAVLQMPLREACHVACQRQPAPQQNLWKHISSRHMARGIVGSPPVLRIVSLDADENNRSPTFDVDLDELLDNGKAISYPAARQVFEKESSKRWAAYIAGCLIVIMTEYDLTLKDGLAILVSSDVPEGKGVSSSAAVEVASMCAFAAIFDIKLDPKELAMLCQKAENLIVGAPCGLMDQMASAIGEKGKLMSMTCQPADVKPNVIIPPHIRFYGIDSGIRHSVGGTDYGSVRVGAFMGRRIIAQVSAKNAERNRDPMSPPKRLDPNQFEDYLANINPSRYEAEIADSLPAHVVGSVFLSQYSTHGDHATSIDPQRTYSVRVPTKHPIFENNRVKCFEQLLRAPASEDQMKMLGELMYQSHVSYSMCGLGSDGTDRLVELVRRASQKKKGPNEGLYAAKITGGGSGGTVCVLAHA
eukprot:scaffold695_cov384-Prasinococcus_capsulatus_cf.AAC.15